MIRLQFVLGSGLSSALISWFGAGHFSHVDCVLPDNSLLGARSDQIGLIPPGVQIRPPAYETWKKQVVFSIPATEFQEDAFYRFLRAQLGKPYDKTAILGFVVGRNWRNSDKWFCSELQAAAGEIAGLWPSLYAPSSKIMPGTLATVVSGLGAVASEAYA